MMRCQLRPKTALGDLTQPLPQSHFDVRLTILTSRVFSFSTTIACYGVRLQAERVNDPPLNVAFNN
jgi:hypothetical protein